jgi:hypothetical protein
MKAPIKFKTFLALYLAVWSLLQLAAIIIYVRSNLLHHELFPTAMPKAKQSSEMDSASHPMIFNQELLNKPVDVYKF